MPVSVKAVAFDVGRVIVQWNLRHLFEQLIEDPEELDWFCANVVTEEWHFEHDAGRSLAEMVPERKALYPDYAHLIDAYAKRFLDTIPGRIPGTTELIERLSARGVPLFAITNFGVEFWQEFCLTEPVLDKFLDIVVSGEERLTKPDPKIFELAEQRFGFAAKEMLFIDDSAANVASARALGWQTHQFLGAPQLEVELIERGLI